MDSFFSDEELAAIGFLSLGRNVRLSRKTSIYGASRISIGDNVRIDDFTILSAGEGITIGRHVHIAGYVSFLGKERITLEDFSQVSGRTSIYSATDDFSGDYLIGPTIPDAFLNVQAAPVTLRRHALIGAACVILPGAILSEGVAVGAMSLVRGTLDPWTIYAGVPAKAVKARSRKMLELEARLHQKGNATPEPAL